MQEQWVIIYYQTGSYKIKEFVFNRLEVRKEKKLYR
jgi:hypothetical protein